MTSGRRYGKQESKSSFLAYILIASLSASIFCSLVPISQFSYATHKNISIELDDDRYRQGDEVAISGTIDDVDDSEDRVTITVTDPNGSEDDHDSTLSSNGDFDWVYDLSSGADDGVYTVEVEYNGDKYYTFFIVDEDNDPVEVETADTTYDAGESVKITGQVDPETGENAVEITVIDPTNHKLLDSKSVNLNGDEFSYTYKLSSTANHGWFAVIVEYNGEEGSTLFEVNEESSGGGSDSSDQITAETSKAAYKPSDTVTITGEISDVDPDEDQVNVVIKNPSGTKLVDKDVDIESDDTFETTYKLASDAKIGKYSVIVSYIDDDLTINFDVSTTASGGSSSFTGKLDKSSYMAGETMTVTGKVPKIVKDETVNVQVFRPDSTPVLASSAFIEPDSDLTYTATLRLKSDLTTGDKYKVKIDYNGEELTLPFAISGQSSDETGDISVKTDKSSYSAGSTVKITGKVASDLIVAGKEVLIRVYNPSDAAYRFDPVTPSSDGSYTYSLVVGGNLGIPGKYTVIASYDKKESRTTFDLTGAEGRSTYSLKAGGKTYVIEYEVTGGGTVKSMLVRPTHNALVVSLDAAEDGQLVLYLPRAVIDSLDDTGSDKKFLVTTTDIEAGEDQENSSIRESKPDKDTRSITIDYQKGSYEVEIAGTSVVPEFGSLSAIILALAIVGIIAITARFSHKFSTNNGRSFVASS